MLMSQTERPRKVQTTKSKAKSMLIQSPITKCIIHKEIYSSKQKSLQSSYEVSAVMHSSERLYITTIIYSDVSMLGRNVSMCIQCQKLRAWMVTHNQKG